MTTPPILPGPTPGQPIPIFKVVNKVTILEIAAGVAIGNIAAIFAAVILLSL